MIGYIPRQVPPEGPHVLEPSELEPSIDPPTYAHPTPALAEAQRYAGESTPAALLLIVVDPAEWTACCGECLVAVNGRHDCSRRSGDLVFPWEAVYRPAGTVRAAPFVDPRGGGYRPDEDPDA